MKRQSPSTPAPSQTIEKILGNAAFRMVDNADWLMGVKLVPFLRDVGTYFTINDLIKRDIIKNALRRRTKASRTPSSPTPSFKDLII